jgi:uncharacterized membrane protein YhaH (DUF805 family)
MENYFKNMTTFNNKGRITRREYLAVSLSIPFIMFIILMSFSIIIQPYAKEIGSDNMFQIILILLATTILYFAAVLGFASVRRLNDTGRSPSLLLLTFIPYIGGLILMYFMYEKPIVGPNQHGPDPRQIK